MKFLTRRINEWLILIVAFLLVYMASGYLIGTYIKSPGSWNNLFSPTSSFMLYSHSAMNAISTFSGNEIVNISTKTMFIIYCSVFMYLIAGPWLFYKGFVQSRNNEQFKKPWQWYVGGILCIASLSIVPTTIVSLIVYDNTMESAVESRIKDNIRETVFDAGYDLAIQVIKDKDTFSLADFEQTFSQPSHITLEFNSTDQDSGFTVVGIYPDYNFRVQADVNPYNDDFIKLRN